MKKLVALFLALITVMAGMTGCAATPSNTSDPSGAQTEGATNADAGGETDTSEEQVTLTWAVFETDNLTAEYWQHIIDTFEADNPNIKIEKVLMTGDSRPQFLKTMMAAGSMPDINVDPVDLASTEGVYAEVPEDLLDNFEDSAVVSFNGKKTLIPAYTALRAQVYYNKDLFAQAGIEEFPTTLDEFTETCQKLQDAGITPLITCGAKDIWATDFGYFTAYLNSEVYSEYPTFNEDLKEGTVDFNNPVVVDAMTYWQDLIKAGYYHKGSMSFSYSQASAEFLKGEAAMMIDGAWVAPSIDSGDDAYAKENIAVAPFPTTDKTYCTMPQYWAVSETCENKEAAFTFCEYVLGGNPELYQYYLQADGLYSITKEPVTYDMGPLQTQFVENFSDYTQVPEIVKLPGDYALPTGLEDFIHKSCQNIYTGADVATEVATWDAEYDKLMNN